MVVRELWSRSSDLPPRIGRLGDPLLELAVRRALLTLVEGKEPPADAWQAISARRDTQGEASSPAVRRFFVWLSWWGGRGRDQRNERSRGTGRR